MDYLTSLANKYASDKGTISPSYGHHGPRLNFTPVYSNYFEKIRFDELVILEIGIGSGPSLKMWYDYFPNAKIHAIDIANQSIHDNDRVKTYIADQSKRDELKEVVDKIGKPIDIIIDDGSHVISHQQISLGFLYEYLKSGGQYWIEDLHTSDPAIWQGKSLYGYDMSFNENESTVWVIEEYIKSNTIKSCFMRPEEVDYLNKNIDMAQLFDLPPTMYGFNKLAYFRKK